MGTSWLSFTPAELRVSDCLGGVPLTEGPPDSPPHQDSLCPCPPSPLSLSPRELEQASEVRGGGGRLAGAGLAQPISIGSDQAALKGGQSGRGGGRFLTQGTEPIQHHSPSGKMSSSPSPPPRSHFLATSTRPPPQALPTKERMGTAQRACTCARTCVCVYMHAAEMSVKTKQEESTDVDKRLKPRRVMACPPGGSYEPGRVSHWGQGTSRRDPLKGSKGLNTERRLR